MAIRWLTIVQWFRVAGALGAACLVLLAPRAGSASSPPDVINQARLEYFHPLTGLTNQLQSDPVRAVVASATNVPLPELHFYADASFADLIQVTTVGQALHVQASAPGCNLDPALAETNLIVLRSEKTGDRESFPAVETAPGSGLFRIWPPVPTRSALAQPAASGNGVIETLKNDTLLAELAGCGTNRTAVSVLVDPGGVVFDSRKNTPVAGASVLLFDVENAQPAPVFQPDGRTAAPNPVVTGPDGSFVFPRILPGTYRLVVTPPPDYTAPSQVPLSELPTGRAGHWPGSYGGSFRVPLTDQAVQVDVPVDAASDPGTGLFVQKSVSRSLVELGDVIEYTVRVKNVSGLRLTGLRVMDQLPLGFAYQRGSAARDGRPVPDPAGGAGPTLRFPLEALADQATVSFTYQVRVRPGARRGSGENTAYAVADGPPRRVSNLARAKVELTGGLFTDRGYLVGKVFVDLNTNRVQDAGEPGVPGVRLFLEDGTYTVSDGEGKFSLYGLRAQTHVLKVDPITLPRGARLLDLSPRQALSPGSRFVDLKFHELHKADFALAPGPPEMLAEIENRRQALGGSASELAAGVKTGLTRDGVPLPVGDPKTRPASGMIGGPASAPDQKPPAVRTNGTNVASFPLTPSLSLRERANGTQPESESGRAGRTNGRGSAPPLPLGGAGRGEGASPVPSTDAQAHPQPWPSGLQPPPSGPADAAGPNFAPATSTAFNPVLPEGTLTEANSGLPAPPAGRARIALEQVLTNLDNTLGFIGLKDGDTLPAPQATVRVKGALGSTFALAVNGTPVPASRLGRRATVADRQLEAWEFVGVSFQPGTNTLTVSQTDAFGNRRGAVSLRVIAPDRLGRIRLLLPQADLPADGQTPAPIVVLLEDGRGVPVTARTPLTLETSLGAWQAEDLNKAEPGVQVFIEGGRAEFLLQPPREPGQAQLRVSSGALQAEGKLGFVPELRPLLAVGLIEGQLSLRSLKAGAILPARSRDGFEEELRHWAARSHDGRQAAAARAAFFLKGKIKGEYLLTAGYDSDKATRERLFRDIQPDEFYPVYGDDAVKGFDAQSTGRLYVRVDKRRCYLLYGDYSTAAAGEARSLGNYSRSLTGLRYHYEKNSLLANLWATHDSTRRVIEEVRANGTSGPYFFRTRDGLVNSEQVEILTRDRHQPDLILKAEPQSRFADYEFEPFTGRLLFRRPIPSVDANLNPLFIRVTYEQDQGGEKFWSYGGDAQAKLSPRWEVGGSGVREENPLAPYGLYSANTTYKLGPRTFLLGEVARSDTAGTFGDAGRAEFRHQGDKTDARVYFGHAQPGFSNAAAVLSGGRTEAGARLSQKLTARDRLLAQAIDSESSGNGPISGWRRGVTAGVEHTFTNQMRLELGGRYSQESAAPASPTTALPAGLTPNEVRSARAKFTTPVPKVKNASVYAEYENDLVETAKRMIAVGGEYQFRQKSRLYARHEFLDALGGPFELNNFQQQNTTVVGLDTAYMKNGQSFNEYRMRDAVSGREAEAAMGLRNQWPIADGLRAHTSFERVHPVLGDNLQNEATAITGGLEYTRNPNWKGTARLELRDATAHNSLLNTLGYARKLGPDWTFLGRTILYLVDNQTPSGHDVVQGRFQAGLAWRQTATDRWNALGKYEFKIEDGDVFTLGAMRRKVNLLSLHANYQPAAAWLLSGHYALKLALEDSPRAEQLYDAHLFAFRLTYDLWKYLDVGLNSAVLFDRGGAGVDYALGPEIGLTIKRNLRLGLGYNFTGFRDRDLGAEDYTQQGLYLALRLKFDEASLGLNRKQP